MIRKFLRRKLEFQYNLSENLYLDVQVDRKLISDGNYCKYETKIFAYYSPNGYEGYAKNVTDIVLKYIDVHNIDNSISDILNVIKHMCNNLELRYSGLLKLLLEDFELNPLTEHQWHEVEIYTLEVMDQL